MDARRTIVQTSCWLLVCLLVATRAGAQSSLQVPIQFDFLNPGARSLAMGGAFVGLADDSTAALVNPAGLIQLKIPEASFEGRFRSMSQPFLIGGRLSGARTGLGQDIVSGPEFQTITDSNFGPSFASFVYPRKSLRFAVFRHELIDLGQTFTSRGVFQNHGFDVRDTAFTGTRTLSVTSYGASIAYGIRGVGIGGGLLIDRFKLGFVFDRYLHESFYGTPDPKQALFHFTQDGRDVGVGAVAGAIVPFAIPKITATDGKIGVAYKRSPRFHYSSFSGGLVGSQQEFGGTFKVPDTLALGGSMVLKTKLLLSAEYTRVFHGQLLDDYVRLLASQGESRDRVDRFTIADGNEVHVGGDYPLRKDGKLRIRAGAWYDPDHSVHYAPTAANDLLDERIAAALSSGRTLWHASAGGFISIGTHVDLSGAVDHSSRSTVVSASAIIYF